MRIIEFIKNFIPLTFLYGLKNFRHTICQKPMHGFSQQRKILYLDAPDYGNLGDQAIAIGIKKFASEFFADYEFLELSWQEFPQHEKYLKENIGENDIIFLTGGGNMGNKYRMFEAVRRRIICNFKKNTIVVFPQTIDYTNNVFGRLSKSRAKKIYNKHNKLIICAREKFSYTEMKSLYNNNTVLLCPDIVLSIEWICESLERSNYSICLRNDGERHLNEDEHKAIHQILKQYTQNYKNLTTSYPGFINKSNRDTIVLQKLNEFANNKLIVTDRLHGMIFAALTATPCIVFRNSNKKIEGVYEWLKDREHIQLLSSTGELNDAIETVLKVDNHAYEHSSMRDLAKTIYEKLNA